jgi:hypothetical protein
MKRPSELNPRVYSKITRKTRSRLVPRKVSPMDGALLSCKGCGVEFRVCKRCWRVQRYCGLSCSSEGRRKSARRSQKKYVHTPKGRRSHARRQRQYRKNHHRQKNSETEHTTVAPIPWLKEEQISTACRFCGKQVVRFIKCAQIFSFRRMVNAHT